MSAPHNSLIEALAAADMLEVDGLHAWQFKLDNELLAQVSAGSASAGSQDRPLLNVEGIDGRERCHWQFSLAAVSAARYDAQQGGWLLEGQDKEHLLKCFDAISADNSDEPDSDDT